MESTISLQAEMMNLYLRVRQQTQRLCQPLEIEDYVAQPTVDVSPPKWHLGHTTWFFETFVLMPHLNRYKPFNDDYAFIFNSYYIAAGDRWARAKRGQLTRPTVKEIFAYRAYVDNHMNEFINKQTLTKELSDLIEMGCHHEQQHQELFLYDIKQILGENPLFPVYTHAKKGSGIEMPKEWLNVEEGVYPIGFEGGHFHYDNEGGIHNVFLHDFAIDSGLVTNGEFIEFIEDGGYHDHRLWLSEGWDWINRHGVKHPLYWHKEDASGWKNYTLSGYEEINEGDPVAHISFYEADAFARWRKCRLPTEQEWEIACTKYAPQVTDRSNFMESEHFRPIITGLNDFYGNLWEWTSSPYVAYPYFKTANGALGEYNGKFMVNQMVLRGGSYGTSRIHIRKTYRNFFHPHLRWMFSGIRLAKHL